MQRAWALLVGAVVFSSLASFGCSSAQFTGAAGKRATDAPALPPAGAPGQPSLSFTCGASQPQSLTGKDGDQLTVSGELCPVVAGSAAVLFVVDFSGSMGRHRVNSSAAPVAGNDPQVNGSCGRLRAAQAVLSQIPAQGGNAAVQVGLVPFAGDVLSSRVVRLMSAASFAALVDKDHFCQYVTQSSQDGTDPGNPGGIDAAAAGVSAATNYQAAFGAAEQLLNGVQGNKTVFFVSDGEPTVPGNGGSTSDQAIQAGVAAGQALVRGVPGVVLNALLLDNQELGAQAQAILTQVAGSSDHVRLAANANSLASEIVKFPSVDLDPASVVAQLAVGGGAPTPIAVASFGKKAGAAGVWSWVTSAFAMSFGGENVITVSARTLDGTPVSTTATWRAARM